MKIACVYHRVDIDGWMSAAIVMKHYMEMNFHVFIDDEGYAMPETLEDAIGSLHLIGWNYTDPKPDLSSYHRVILVDICFCRDLMVSLSKSTDLVWLDHHQTSIDMMADMEITGIQDKSYAACELTYMFFFGENAPELVTMLGKYDSFRSYGTSEHDKVVSFNYGARNAIYNVMTAYNTLVYSNQEHFMNQFRNNGAVVMRYLTQEAVKVYENGFIIQVNGKSFKCINKQCFNPEHFGIRYADDGLDGIIAYFYNGRRWSCSIYSYTMDISGIAKGLGGGGHKGAAGFILENIGTLLYRRIDEKLNNPKTFVE